MKGSLVCIGSTHVVTYGNGAVHWAVKFSLEGGCWCPGAVRGCHEMVNVKAGNVEMVNVKAGNVEVQ